MKKIQESPPSFRVGWFNNGTYAEYFDLVNEKSGALEIIKTDGDQYIVDSSFDGDDKSKTKDCLKYLDSSMK
ncbi:hypothetical protein [Methanobrevibacter sp.]|uniref:hypothetical protein n=1 Tax=Methanobrevibacter sp. TaxID=66852 RepID=UPI0038674E56